MKKTNDQTNADLIQNVVKEFTQSPIAATSGAVGVCVGSLSLLLAWFQFQAPPVNMAPVIDGSILLQESINTGNLLLTIAFFLSTTFSLALAMRAIAREHALAALAASVPVAALINFLTMLIIYLAPARVISKEVFINANDLVLYASIIIFVAICCGAVVRNLANADEGAIDDELSGGDSEEDTDMSGVVIVALVVLLFWSVLVFKGQKLLSVTFLPDVAHPIGASIDSSVK